LFTFSPSLLFYVTVYVLFEGGDGHGAAFEEGGVKAADIEAVAECLLRPPAELENLQDTPFVGERLTGNVDGIANAKMQSLTPVL
jgi:hypothetical protein